MPTVAEMATYDAILADVAAFVYELPKGTIVVSGGANGVDKTAAKCARDRGLEVVEYLPDYERYASSKAPLERNTLIAADVDELHAWPVAAARGTWDTITKARVRGITITIHTPLDGRKS